MTINVSWISFSLSAPTSLMTRVLLPTIVRNRRPARTTLGRITFCAVSLLTLAASLGSLSSSPAFAAGDALEPPQQNWSFSGVFGTFDVEATRRGYRVYKEVCASCHSMNLLAFRNLGQPGGPAFTENQVKAIASEFTVVDGPNEDGEMFERPGTLPDRFVAPFANDNEARAANGGALPPDLSVITKARTVSRGLPRAFFDLFTGYQEGGPDYLYALLTGYQEAPAGFELNEGLAYNPYFPGSQLAMTAPLVEDGVEYADGTKATVEQMAHDVVTFLAWAAEPHQNARKRMGFQVIIYLSILALFLYFANRRLWASVKGKNETSGSDAD